MNRPSRSTRSALFAGLALLVGPALFGGCAGSQMTNMWKDPSYTDGPIRNVLAIAVRQDPVRRRIWEDDFVAELREHGVNGSPSYTTFADAVPDTLQVIEAVRAGGYDAVAISARLPNVTEETYVAGYSKLEPVRDVIRKEIVAELVRAGLVPSKTK
jgi:hypothetical protein